MSIDDQLLNNSINTEDGEGRSIPSANRDCYDATPATQTQTTAISENITLQNDNEKMKMTKLKYFIDVISELFDAKLKKNNKAFLNEFKNTIHSEISKAIEKLRNDFTKSTNTLKEEQKIQKNDLTTIQEHIKDLKKRNTILCAEIQELQKIKYK